VESSAQAKVSEEHTVSVFRTNVATLEVGGGGAGYIRLEKAKNAL
jgi:hypothetical protein